MDTASACSGDSICRRTLAGAGAGPRWTPNASFRLSVVCIVSFPLQSDSGEKMGLPNADKPMPLQTYNAPNVTTLLRVCGNWFAIRYVGGRVRYRLLREAR